MLVLNLCFEKKFVHFLKFLGVLLASRIAAFLITYVLADIQIRMASKLDIIMDAGLPASFIEWNCQKESFDRDEKATTSMSLAVALCLIPKTIC
jgi:hypothetical protein